MKPSKSGLKPKNGKATVPILVVMDKTTIEIVTLVTKFFNNDYEKVALWMRLDNLNFGGISPNKLISWQKGHKVLQFVRDALGEGYESVIKSGGHKDVAE
jgi:hypothetical protein